MVLNLNVIVICCGDESGAYVADELIGGAKAAAAMAARGHDKADVAIICGATTSAEGKDRAMAAYDLKLPNRIKTLQYNRLSDAVSLSEQFILGQRAPLDCSGGA